MLGYNNNNKTEMHREEKHRIEKVGRMEMTNRRLSLLFILMFAFSDQKGILLSNVECLISLCYIFVRIRPWII